jgi:AhpD family alkylhydroperoxidase
MTARMNNPAMVLPDAAKAVPSLLQAIAKGGVPGPTLELVHLRVSQINGCSACVYGGIHKARKEGESDERLHMVAVWRESDLFSAPERAALALAEAATRLADRPDPVNDEVWAEAARYFDEPGLAALVLMIAMTNFFNRINVSVRQPAGAVWD